MGIAPRRACPCAVAAGPILWAGSTPPARPARPGPTALATPPRAPRAPPAPRAPRVRARAPAALPTRRPGPAGVCRIRGTIMGQGAPSSHAAPPAATPRPPTASAPLPEPRCAAVQARIGCPRPRPRDAPPALPGPMATGRRPRAPSAPWATTPPPPATANAPSARRAPRRWPAPRRARP